MLTNRVVGTEGQPFRTETLRLSLFPPPAEVDISIADYYERHFADAETATARSGYRSAGTRTQYRTALNHLARHVGRSPLLTEVTKPVLQSLTKDLLERSSVANANKVRRHLLAILRAAKADGRIAEVPPLKRLKEPRRIPQAWTIEQVGRILAVTRDLPGQVGKIRASVWWSALVLVLYDTGLRIGAAMQLRWDWLDADSGYVIVPAEAQKQNADQVLSISGDTLRALDRLPARRELILPWPYDPRRREWRTLRRRLKKILAAAGLPTGRRDLFHKFRRTNASYIKAGGGNPTDQLGHSSPLVTRAYLDPTIANRQRLVDLLPRPETAGDDPQLRLF